MSSLFSGIDSTHVILLCVSIAAEGAVAWGIWLESPKIKTCRDWFAMGLVLGGVVVGAICTIVLFVFDEGTSRQVAAVAQSASQTAAEQGVQVTEHKLLLDDHLKRIAVLEQKVKSLETNGKTAKPPVPTPSPIPVSGRHIGPSEARTIRSVTLPGATISIIPFTGALEEFANAMASAFEAVKGVQVAVGHGNLIVNGQEGLIVQYDHSNSVSASVFDALVKAGLKPTPGPPVIGPVVYIKVASL